MWLCFLAAHFRQRALLPHRFPRSSFGPFMRGARGTPARWQRMARASLSSNMPYASL